MMRPNVERYSKVKGFSLVELAVVFLISGFIMAFSTQFLSVYIQKNRYEKTNQNLTLTQKALEEYFALQGRYPCPADPTLDPTNINYGRERCRPVVTNSCLAGLPPNIKCTMTGSRDADNDSINDTVLIGAVPFKDVFAGIVDTPFAMNNAQDAFNMNFTYAVSEKMVSRSYNVVNPANFNLGAISVRDENSTEVLDPAESAHFVIVSHGDNKLGAYSYSGTRFSLCLQGLATDPPGMEPIPGLNAVGVAPEKENCDNNDAIFITALRSMVEGSPDYFDDSIRYTSSALKNHWTYSLASTTSNIYNTNIGNVGVGVADPLSKLHVANNISAEVAVGAMTYCKFGADPDCFETNNIAGTGSICPIGEVAKGISFKKIVCEKIFLTPPTIQCPANEFLVGLSNLGNIRCEPLN